MSSSNKKKRERFPSFEIKGSNQGFEFTTVDAHIDPKHGDIVINGYGVKWKQARGLRDWLTQALRIASRK